jgi:hypothetical protein
MELTATEKLLKRNFGISSFKQVIAKLEKEPEETFSKFLFVKKELFTCKIKALNNEINIMSDAYSEGLKMAESGPYLKLLHDGNLAIYICLMF